MVIAKGGKGLPHRPLSCFTRFKSCHACLLVLLVLLVCVAGRGFPPKRIGDGVHVPPSGTGVRQQRGTEDWELRSVRVAATRFESQRELKAILFYEV